LEGRRYVRGCEYSSVDKLEKLVVDLFEFPEDLLEPAEGINVAFGWQWR